MDEQPAGCATCGTTADPEDPGALVAWVRGVEDGRVVWTCPACSRRFLRSIEGKLDSQWW
jgi:hypothetical protein